jgi:hypothetical protein
MNANDAKLTEITTAQSGSSVEDSAPNAPAQPGFDIVVEAVAGNAIGNSGAPYTLTITAMDLTDVAPATDLNPVLTGPQFFDGPTGWKPNGPDFEYSATFPITVPVTAGARKYAGHVLQYVASLVNHNGQIVSILESDPFVLV